MFCSNCGKNLADDARFCDGCGAQLGAPAAAPAAVAPQKAQNPMFNNFLNNVKGVFSKNTVKTVGEAAKSTGMEWIIAMAISAVVYAFALAVNLKQIIMSVIKSVVGGYASMVSSFINVFGTGFLYGLLISLGTFFVMSVLIFGTMKLVFKKDVKFTAVLNLVATASLPLTAVYALNMLLGLIWAPLVFVFSAAGLVATVVLLYVGMQKLEKLESSPFVAYTGIWAIIIALVVIIVCVAVKSAIGDALGGLASGLMGGLGDLSSLMGLY